MSQVSAQFWRRVVGNRIRFYSTAKASRKWKSVVGLEIHAQIASSSKLFSGAKNSFADSTNTSVALLDASIPGSLPVLNRKCVEAGVKTALAMSCQINEVSMFDRKHYFYADLPAGYQITQQRAPLASNGTFTFPVFVPGVTKKPYYKTVRLHQLQLEQDSGKSLHDEDAGISFIDLNRAGVPLMELVFDPDLTDGEEAAALVKELILILETLETCNCKMEEGSLRVDANISIHKEGEPLGTRTEVKNIGSIRAVAQAVEFEIERQIQIKNKGGVIVNETRSWDAPTKSTITMRDKEVVQDYRFMPEPNLPPLHLSMAGENEELVNVSRIRENLPPLPQELRENLITSKSLTQVSAIILVNEPVLFKYFNDITSCKASRPPQVVANFLINELLTIYHKNKIDLQESRVPSIDIGELVDMLESEETNLMLAKLILQEMIDTGKPPRSIADEKNWKMISDNDEVLRLCKQVLATENGQKMANAYKSGKTKVLFAIAGEIKKISDNRINMAKVVESLKDLLSK